MLALGAFVAWKAHAVAWELTDPPFYRVQPLARVQQTYEELARGNDADRGGVWHSEEVSGLQLWTLERRDPAKGLVLLLHGFGDDRWGTSPALRWFPDLDAAIFTYRRRDDAMRNGGPVPFVTFGARESEEVVRIVHHLESKGLPRNRIILLGRSLGASVGLMALAKLETESKGPLGGIIWEGAPASSRDFGERLVRGSKDRFWHPALAPLIGDLGSRWAAFRGGYCRADTDTELSMQGRRFATPSLCFLATQDRLAPPPLQRRMAARFASIRVLETETWHLHCAEVLGPRYGEAMREATAAWLK
jgi:pimeloyl-ACP methyl ester carboxylesterase